MIKKLIAKKLKTMTKKEDPQDVGLDIFLDECHHGYYQEELPDCGLEHPKLAGNYCILVYDHLEMHEDAAGNRWYGKDL